jgi:hypothetical protein
LTSTEERWSSLWQSFQSVSNLLRTSKDNGSTWGQFIPLIPTRLQEFIKRGAHVCIQNVLAHIQVLASIVSLERLTEEADKQEYLDVVEQAKPGVDALAE